MRAVRFHQHGGPEVLRCEDAPDPAAGPGQALIRVRACALNHLDLWQRRGLERVRIPMPHISGADIAGEAIDGDLASVGIAQGSRVLLQPGVSCGRCHKCVAGLDNECPSYTVIGYMVDGGYAERLVVPVVNLVPLPDHIDFVDAAAFPLTFLTAWHMLMTRARIQPGEDVLVLAASSGVGQALVQLAKLAGARVIVTAGDDEKAHRARTLGADHVINHYTQTIADEVKRITDRRGVDVVCEHVGRATWDQSLRSLTRGGRLVTCGATTGHGVELDLRVLFAKRLSLLGSYMGVKADLLKAASLFFAGRVKPVVDRTLPLEEAGEAHRLLEAGKQFGKIVLSIG